MLLVGQPNVGKSVIFCHLTGLHIEVSNYPGTTVDYTEGRMTINGISAKLIDAPGTYGLQATNQAEQVTVDLLKQGPAAVLCVIDSINLESGLHLLLQVLAYDLPTIVVLNRSDLAVKHGLTINHALLEAELGVPVIPAVAVEGNGLAQIKATLHQVLTGVRPEIAACTSCVGCAVRGCHGGYHAPPTLPPPSAAAPVDADESAAIWARAESLAARVSDDPLARGATLSPDPLVQPWPGIPIALGIVGLMFGLVIGLGMGLRRFLILPFFRGWVFPVIEAAVTAVVGPLWLRNILIGEYGFLIKGLDWPFALVLPYVISFYLGLSILEDWGYLPRLGVLLDGLYKKIGLNGACTIPLLLGYGCGIPAIMSTRSLPTRKQRVMVSAMVCFAVPCVSQTGAFISLLAERSIGAVALLFLLSIAAIVTLGALIDKLNPEAAPYTILEMPELLAPKPRILAKKVWMRVRHYIFDGAVPMIVAVLIAALLYELGILEILGEVFAPLISGWLRLPNEAVVPLILGIVRRELAVLPLIDMELTTLQFITSAVIALFYVPCIAMVATMAKEFGLKVAAATLAFTTFAALFFGGLLAQLGALLPFV